jgi:hypothetical protein
VGWPGGHVEGGETDTDAVVREVKEEVGFNLHRRDLYHLLGEVTPRSVAGRSGSLVVCCHVYLQLGKSEQICPDASEVAAAGWAPIHCLLDDTHVAPLDWSVINGGGHKDSHFDDFPSVHLPLVDMVVAPGSDGHIALISRRFRLWGLTLRMVNDLLIMCGLRNTPIGADILRGRL